jgi:putative membrane protein
VRYVSPMHLLAAWVTLAFGLWIISALLPGFSVKGFQGALIGGAVFGILHFFIGWLLFVLIGVGTLFIGFVFAFITRWIVTAIVLKITDAFSDNIQIDSFGTALLASALLSVLSSVRDFLIH